VLKYDVRLITGVTTWPPGPGTIYLPLCDVTQDGKCNSTDALRILMCDVGLAACPVAAAAAQIAPETPSAAPPAYFTLEQTVDAAAGQVALRVRAASPHTPLAAAALELRYDPARWSVVSCAENPAGRLDLAACNPAYASGALRHIGVTIGGIVEAAPLVELRLLARDPAALAQAAQGAAAAELSVTAAFDLDGHLLRPLIAAPPPVGGPRRLYLPVIFSAASSPPAPSGPIARPYKVHLPLLLAVAPETAEPAASQP